MSRRKAEREEEIALESDDPNALTAKQEQALQAVISYPTLKEAALAAGKLADCERRAREVIAVAQAKHEEREEKRRQEQEEREKHRREQEAKRKEQDLPARQQEQSPPARRPL